MNKPMNLFFTKHSKRIKKNVLWKSANLYCMFFFGTFQCCLRDSQKNYKGLVWKTFFDGLFFFEPTSFCFCFETPKTTRPLCPLPKKKQKLEKSLLFQRLPTSIKKTCCLRTFVVRENVWFWLQKVEGVWNKKMNIVFLLLKSVMTKKNLLAQLKKKEKLFPVQGHFVRTG